MHTNCLIVEESDSTISIQVNITAPRGEITDMGFFPDNTQSVFIVTIDKIIGHTIVHLNGITRRTQLQVEAAEDHHAVWSRLALLAALHFQR